MISFNNKFLSILAAAILLYLLANTFADLKQDMSNQSERYSQGGLPISSKNSIVIDPAKSPEDLSFTEKMAIKLFAPEYKKELQDSKNQQLNAKDRFVKVGDKVYFEVRVTNEVLTYTEIVDENNKNVSPIIIKSLMGMKINEVKKIQEEGTEKELKVLYIESKEKI